MIGVEKNRCSNYVIAPIIGPCRSSFAQTVARNSGKQALRTVM